MPAKRSMVASERSTPMTRLCRALAKSAFVLLAFSPAFVVTGSAAAPGQSLPYFTSYSVVGDYAIGSIDLSQMTATGGFVNGTIHMTGLVPANADILAAFLFYQLTAGVDPPPAAKFRDQDIHSVSMSVRTLVL